jgi:hypothetical protein
MNFVKESSDLIWGRMCHKTFFFVIYEWANKARVLILASLPFQPVRQGSHTRGASERCSTWVGSGLPFGHKAWLESFARDKYSSFFDRPMRQNEKKF